MAGVVANSSIYVVASTLQKLAAVVLLPVYTRILSPTEYGFYNTLVLLVLLACTVATVGLDFGAMRFCHPTAVSENDEPPDPLSHKRYFSAIVTAVLTASVVVFSILLVAAPYYSNALFPGLDSVSVVSIGLVAILFQPLTVVFLSALQARSNAMSYGVLSVGYFLLNAAFTVAFVGWKDLGLSGAALALAASNGVFFAFSVVLAFRDGLLWHRFSFDDLRKIVSYSLPMVPHSVSLQATALGIRVIVSNAISVAATGIFSIAMYAVNVVDAFQTALHRAFLPWFFAEMRERNDSSDQRLNDATVMVVAANVLVGGFVAIFANEIVSILTPGDFRDAALIIPILAVSMMVKAPYYPCLSVMLFFQSGTRSVLVVSGVSCAICVLLSIPGAIFAGLFGVALAQVAQRICMTFLAAFMSRRMSSYSLPWRRVIYIVMIGVLFGSIAALCGYLGWFGWGFLLVVVIKALMAIVMCGAVLFVDPALTRAVLKGVRFRGKTVSKGA